MKIAIPSTGEALDSMVADRFARADYFIIYDDTGESYSTISNSEAVGTHGAGPRVIQMLAREGVDVLIVPGIGYNAFSAAMAAGIKLYLSKPGSVKQNLEWLKQGELEEIKAPTKG